MLPPILPIFADFLPHGFCLQWQPGLLAAHVAADALIALAYFCIPPLLWSRIKKRPTIRLNWIVISFGLFILACGITHVMDIVTLWLPLYRLSAFFKIVTAIVSITTVVALYKLMPHILHVLTPSQLQSQERQRLQGVLDGATNVSIIATDPNGLITLFNSGAENLLGYTSQEMIGKESPSVFHLESEVVVRGMQLTAELGKPVVGFEVLVEKARSGQHDEWEWTYVRKDGSHLTVNLVVSALYDENHSISGFLGVAMDMSGRKKAEAASRASDELFRLIVQTIDDYALISLDARGFITSWNTGAERIKGYTAKEIIGQHFSCFYQPHDVERSWPDHELRIAAEQGRYSEEGWRVRKDGSLFLSSVIIAAMHDATGKLRGFAKIVRDITELRKTEERFQLVVEASPSAMIMVGVDGLITLVNTQTEKLFGFDRHELVGKPLEMLLPQRFQRQHGSHLSGFFAAPSTRAMGVGRELFGLCKDGTEVPVEIGLNPIDATGGQFVLASVIDITERKRAGNMLRDQALILDLANDSVIVRDRDDRITYWNRGSQRLYGFTKEEALGKVTHALFNTQFPEPLEDIQKQLNSNGYWKGELQHTLHDGSVITVASNWTLKRDGTDGLLSVLEINGDITAAKKAQSQANEQTAQLKVANHELEQFAYAASHDLKAPLRVIDNASKWLEEDLEQHLTPETREHLTLMRSRIKRMDKLLDDLLQYARIGRAIDNRYGETVTGKSLLYDVLALLPTADFTITVDPAFASIQVCRMPLQHIFMNLIGNAIKHHNKQTGSIAITAEDNGDNYCFGVKDDGPGIPAQFHTAIFKMFQTLKPRDQVEGSGMGLAMVRKSIEVFGGALQLESAEGQGSTFRFTWPKIQQQPKREAA